MDPLSTMRRHIFSVVALPIVLALLAMPLGSRAFVARQARKKFPSFGFQKPDTAHKTTISLQARRSNDDDIGSANSIIFQTLSTDRDNQPNQGTFFYNDEVISHLYGYMYLVGFFAAQDALFLGNFLVLSSVTAYLTQESLLPCNARIPAVTAAMTLALTLVLRYGLGFEPPLEGIINGYTGPTESAFVFEVVICLLNIGWGFFGTWRTKEQVNGATYGF